MRLRLERSACLGLKAVLAVSGVALLAYAAGEPRNAAAAGPFSQLSGNWSGSGMIRMASGANERLRCRVRYGVKGDGNDLNLDLRCASDSYRFDLTGQFQHRGGSVSGNWAESSRGVGGRVAGRASGNTIQALAESNAFSANLVLNTRGNQQSVSITTPGSDVREISVTLRKGN